MPVLDGACEICGSPCHDWGSSYQIACAECAIKVEHLRDTTLTVSDLRKYYEGYGGEGFASHNKNFDKVKIEYQKSKMNSYFDCRTSPDSTCKDKKEHDASTVKEYLVNFSDGKGDKKVCICQHHYDNRVKFGWQSDYQWKALDGQGVVDKKIELSSLKVGQRVQVELTKASGKVAWATVIEARASGAPLIYFDEAQREPKYSSWKGYSDNQASLKELKLDVSKPNCWFAYKDQIKVLQVKERVSDLKSSSFKAGQRIQVDHNGHKSWATVVISNGSCNYSTSATLVYFDDQMTIGGSSWSVDSSFGSDIHAIKQIAPTLGLDTSQRKFRYITDLDSKILDASIADIAFTDLKEGDRVHVLLGSEKYVWATVVQEGNVPVFYLDEPIKNLKEGGTSWESVASDEIAVKYGLAKSSKNYWTAHSRHTAIVAKGKPLTKINEIKEKEDNMSEPQQYTVGEEIKVSIFGKEYLATVVRDGKKGTNYGYTNSGCAVIYLPPRNGIGWQADGNALREAIKDRGLGNGYANNCYYLNGDVKVIKRLNEDTTKKGEDDMGKKVNKYKVGDRIKIHADSGYPFTGWATVISLKGFEGDANQPLLFMDEEQDDTWPWEEEWQRKAAIKAGLDPERACFWWLGEEDTTVLETEEKVEESKKFTTMMKNDMVDAGYRVAGHQMTKGVKAGLLKLFKDKGADDSKLRIVEELLDSEVGSSMIALMLGYGLAYIPNISEDPRIQKLSKEFRVGGMSTAGNMIMDTAIEYLAPAVLGAVDKLPPIGTMASAAVEKSGIKKKGKKRVAATVRVKEEAKEQEHEVEEETSKKVAVSSPA